MPETTEEALCVKVDKVISEEGYRENFLPRLKTMVEKFDEVRILLYYADFKGWEHDAAKEDMVTSALFGNKLTKFALVNPPESEIFQKFMKKDLFAGEMKMFNEDKLQDAIDWVKS